MDRRNLLLGLVSLPLIGSGVTLIGRPAVRVPLADVAVAPLLDDPRQRARYAWEAFSAAMREVTAGADGWHVQGGQRLRTIGPVAECAWIDARAINTVPLTEPGYRHGYQDRHASLDLR